MSEPNAKQRRNDYHKWLVFASCFTVMVVGLAYFFNQGALFVVIMKRFNSTRTETALIQSISSATCFGSGILVAPIIHKTGIRLVAFAGAVLSTTCLFLSVFVTTIQQLLITMGVFFGFGISPLLVGALTIMSQHFEGHKFCSLFLSLTVFGSGLGGMIYPFFLQYLEYTYGLSGVFLILTGLYMNIPVLVILWTPPKNNKNVENSVIDVEQAAEVKHVTTTNNLSFEPKSYNKKDVGPLEMVQGDNKNNIAQEYNRNNKDKNVSDTPAIYYNSAIDISQIDYTDPKKVSENIQKRAASPTFIQSFKFLCSQKVFWTLAVGNALSGTILILLKGFITDIMSDRNFTDSNASLALTLNSVLNGIGRLAMGLPEKIFKISPMAKLTWSMFTSILFLVGILLTKPLVLLLMFFSPIGFFHGMLIAGLNVVYVKLFGAKHFHNATGISYTLSCICFASVGPMFGYIRDTADSYTLVLILMASGCAFAWILFLLSHIFSKKAKKNTSV